LYSLTIFSTYAANSNVRQTALKTSGDTGIVKSKPIPSLGFKALNHGTKGAYIGKANAVYKIRLHNVNSYLDLAYVFLLVVKCILIDRLKK